MSYLTGVNRSAALAWSPISDKGSFFATATAAGSTDSNFDTSAYLESFCLEPSLKDLTLPAKYKLELADRVHSLAWGEGGKYGILAAGYSSGSISFIDGAPLVGEE